jgi:hypothetical protein
MVAHPNFARAGRRQIDIHPFYNFRATLSGDARGQHHIRFLTFSNRHVANSGFSRLKPAHDNPENDAERKADGKIVSRNANRCAYSYTNA